MLNEKIVSYLKTKEIWFDEPAEEYKNVLRELGIPEESDFAKFFLHVEGSPNFINSKGEELLQICWHYINTNYKENIKNLLDSINLPDSYILLSSFEVGIGWFYDKETQNTLFIDSSKKLHKKREAFENFLMDFFEI